MQRRMRALSRLLLCHHVISLVVIHTSAFVSPFTERATPRQQHYGSTTDDHDEKKQAFVDNNSLDLTPLAFGTIPDAFSLDDDVTGMATSVSDASSLAEASAQAAALQVAPPPSSRANNKLPLIQLALAGSLTTLVVDILMHPVDCIKTLQQSDAGLDYTLAQAAQFLWSTYGLAGFYHGFLTYAVSDALGGALKFSVWETWKDKSSDFVLYDKISWLYVWIGAALAFVASSVFVVPGELLKQQLQMSYFDSVQTAVFGIFARSGLSGFFVGYDGVLYRDVPYTILELGLYDLFKYILDANRPPHREASAVEEVSAAAVTGAITAILTTPIDVVKTKLMVDFEYAGDSFLSCLLKSVENHGVASIFAGVEARILWIMPFVAIYLPLYDFLKRQLWARFKEQQLAAQVEQQQG